MKISTREYDPQIDESFIYSSWLKSSRCRCDFTKLPNSVYFPNYKKLIESCLSSHKIIVACSPDDESQVFGYIVYRHVGESKIIFFAYTKFTYRKLGVFKRLVLEAFGASKGIIFNTHRTSLTDEISKRYELIYNPFLFWSEK